MFDSSKIVKGQRIEPPRICLHGQEKVGKTTFAAGAPSPFFLQCEKGAEEIGPDRTEVLSSLQEVQDVLKWVYGGEHKYETVVIDSGDWLERLIHSKVAADAGVANIESIGYGKGYITAVTEWDKILKSLDMIREKRGMACVIINHTEVKRFDSPETEPYDRFTLKLHKSASALIQEWADVLGFACKEQFVQKTDVGFNKEIRRGVTNGKRVLRLEGTPAYVAGNRYGLPPTIPLEWSAFVDSFSKSRVIKQAAE